MPTLDQLIGRLRSAAGDHPQRDQLDGALNAAVTTATVDSGESIAVGHLLDIDLEVIRVTAKPSTVTATIVRGQRGSTDANHSDNAEVLINPNHTRFEYAHAINRALGAISAGFGKPTWDTAESFGSSTHLVQVPAAAKRVGGVFAKPSGQTDLVPIPFEWWPSAPTGLITSGRAVRLVGAHPSTGSVYVLYEQSWPSLSSLSGSLDSTFPEEGEDLITLGGMAYLEDDALFERLAFTEAQALTELDSSQPGEIRLAGREHLVRFFQRRSELAARFRTDRVAWMTAI